MNKQERLLPNQYPSLATEWHPTKNGNLKPTDFVSGSKKKVWWICDKGEDHEWKATISHRSNGTGCPFCVGQKVSNTNNLAYLYPKLASEWHPTKNGNLKPTDITPGSDKKVWWICDKGEDHEWETASSNRIKGRGCPFCSGRKASKTNNITFLFPELAKEWHPVKNGKLKPTDVTPGSDKKVWWICNKDEDHEWEASIFSRKRGSGCPFCCGQKVSKTNNLAYLNPTVAQQWHPTKNGILKPTDVTSGSSKKAWWLCNKGDDHEWEASIIARKNGRGCPFCL